jgi:hypothetical protein
MRRSKPHAIHPDSKDQAARFIETARALGCDEDEAAFKAKLAVIARQKPKGEVPSMPDPDKADD